MLDPLLFPTPTTQSKYLYALYLKYAGKNNAEIAASGTAPVT